MFMCLAAGCTNSLIKEVHHFRILGEHQVRRFCTHTANLWNDLNQSGNSLFTQMCLCFSMSAISSMVLRNACWGTGDSCVPHLAVGRGLSHLMTPEGWSVTDRSAVGLSSAETAGRPTMRGCVPQHCPKPLLKPHRWVYTASNERISTEHEIVGNVISCGEKK